MKYFTPELWASWQDPTRKDPPPDKDPFKLYRAQLDGLRDRVNAEAFRFFSEADVHDGELLEFSVLDGSRCAPPGEAGRPWETRDDYPVRVSLRVLEASDRLVWRLRYSAVRRVAVQYPGQADLFQDQGRGFGDWGYHELSDCGSGFLRHEVLFASGSILLVEFRGVEAEAAEARPGAAMHALRVMATVRLTVA
jgi:hypothetical protein